MSKLITTSLSPNSSSEQAKKALSFANHPKWWSKWKEGDSVTQLESKIKNYIGVSHAISFLNGRTAFYAILKAYGINKGDEVIIQAYTCVVVPNSVIASGATPIFVDIDNTFNMDPIDIQSKITKDTKAIVVQHTFGTPANIEAIQKIAKENNIVLIEDCAHSLGTEYKNQKIGSFADASFFSFGRDKVISSVSGGMATTNSEKVAKKLQKYKTKAKHLSRFEIKRHLMYIPLITFVKKTYTFFSLGKAVALVSKKCNITPLVITKNEKEGKHEKLMYKLPDVLAKLALQQLENLEEINQSRRTKAKYYTKKLKENNQIQLPNTRESSKEIYLRYTIMVPSAKEILDCAKKQNIYLGDWYTSVIAPSDINLQNTQYQKGSCPNAEKAARQTINLPNHHEITTSDQDRVIKILQKCIKKNDRN